MGEATRGGAGAAPALADALEPVRGLNEAAALGAFVAVCLKVAPSAYSAWSIDAVGRFVLPSVRLGQYVVFADEAGPQGFVSWGWLSDDVLDWLLTRHEDPRPYEWRSGPNLLIGDFVCRPGLVPLMARHLQRRVFVEGSPDHLHDFDHARAIKRDAAGAVVKTSRWPRWRPRG